MVVLSEYITNNDEIKSMPQSAQHYDNIARKKSEIYIRAMYNCNQK